jgi:hypothetical protein
VWFSTLRSASQSAAIVADRNQPRKHVERARIVLASADRHSAQRVAQRIGVSRPTVRRWQQRFAAQLADVVGLYVDPPAHAVVLSLDEKSQICRFRGCRPVIPRLCRPVFRHDVAWLNGVLLAVGFCRVAGCWSILYG